MRLNWGFIGAVLLTLFLWLMLILCAKSFCEELIDPNEVILKWEFKSLLTLDSGITWFTYQNPNKKSAIKRIVLVLAPNLRFVLAYRYFLGREPVVWAWDGKKFIRLPITPQHRASCLACHNRYRKEA